MRNRYLILYNAPPFFIFTNTWLIIFLSFQSKIPVYHYLAYYCNWQTGAVETFIYIS